VRGTISGASQNGSTFFINFDNTRTSFYAVSFKFTWDNLKGKCVEISGKIVPYSGRTEIVVDKQEQLKMCQ
jgi:DNA/RNA endonuclease YhcR with UshA esterase domain